MVTVATGGYREFEEGLSGSYRELPGTNQTEGVQEEVCEALTLWL